ncbi:MAG TPA: hypothetical protein VKU41_16915 [Polyangiaceae bacterium]|nr:hypothetical protein [Polyangiaceae bacterium]
MTKGPPRRAAAWLFACGLSCARGGARTAATDAAADVVAPSPASPEVRPAPESPATAHPLAAWPPVGVAPGEAQRATLPRLEADASLRPYLAALREHFGAAAPGPFELQSTALVGGRTGLLLTRASGGDPMAIVVDREGIDWSKPRPTAGIVPPVEHLAIAPRPDGGLAVFGWVATLRTVAARMWAEDSFPFGDFELFAPPACDALSAAYAPGAGWLVACSSAVETRAQRMREDATVAWGRDGVAVGASGAAGPATLLFDSASTFVVVQRVAAIGGDRLLAHRYDLQGEALWTAPSQIGLLAAGGAVERFRATAVREGVVRVELPRGLAGKPARAAEVSADGSISLVR